jgi:dipeptidyl-peptidase-4
MMVLHEFSHAYHDQVLGYDYAPVREAYEHAKEKKLYDDVLRANGHRERAYCMNNDQEYFAEQSEAFFGTNDFYPFVRAELERHDPEMAAVLKKAWGVGD